MNDTQNNEWRDLLPDEPFQNGDEKLVIEYDRGQGEPNWTPVADKEVGMLKHQTWGGNGRTRRPLPNQTQPSADLVPKSEPSRDQVDPIAQAIKQMEEAARVLKSQFVKLELENRNGELGYNAYCVGWGGRKASLSEALGYKSPQQEKEEKIREAERLEDEARHLIVQYDKLSQKAEKLREEAGV